MKSKTIFALLTAMICHGFVAPAQTWTQTSVPYNFWNSVASSADGTKLIAVGNGSPLIYLSANSGATWSSNNVEDPSAIWKCAASSADGNILIAGSADGALYVSTNAGAVWTQTPATSVTNYWISVACSADGTKIVAASLGGGSGGLIYTSTNSGVTWVANDVPVSSWASVASSADGSKLLAVAGFPDGGYGFGAGPIMTSTNSGGTWTSTSAPSNTWTSIACSADGKRMIAGSLYDTFLSTNFGLTWTYCSIPAQGIGAVACSADGSKLVVGVESGQIYTSFDSGVTWISNNVPLDSPPSDYGWAVASSADGAKLVAAVFPYAEMFTSSGVTSPQLNLASSSSNLCVSWLIPSTTFALQQSSDLINWSDVTNTPVLNFTNLQNQVTLPVSSGNAFYRLAVP